MAEAPSKAVIGVKSVMMVSKQRRYLKLRIAFSPAG